MPDTHQIGIHFLPELLLLSGAVIVMGYDLVAREHSRRQAWLAGLALILSMAATLWLFTLPDQSVFEARDLFGHTARAGAFVSDAFTHYFRLVSQLATLLVLVAGGAFMQSRTTYRGEFYALLLFAALAMSLMAGANDLVMIFLSIEFLSITSYILTAYVRSDALALEGAVKYFLYGSVTSAAMLYGLVLLYGASGSTSLPVVAERIRAGTASLLPGLDVVVLPALLLVMAGVGYKIALVPFHQWSPDAYQGAASPVTAFLSVGPKAAGLAVLMRLLAAILGAQTFDGGWLSALAVMAVASMVLGNLAALTQGNLKRMMAYSSIAQAGYMLVGVASLAGAGRMAGVTPLGSVLLFLLAYLFTNLGAFAVIIAMDDAHGSAEIETYAGLMRRSPLLATSLFVFFLSLIGIPPLAGFVGKFSVFAASIASGQSYLAVVGVVTGVISVAYYFRVAREMFFARPAEDAAPLRLAPGPAFVVVASLVMVLLIGLFATQFIDAANAAARALPTIIAGAAATH